MWKPFACSRICPEGGATLLQTEIPMKARETASGESLSFNLDLFESCLGSAINSKTKSSLLGNNLWDLSINALVQLCPSFTWKKTRKLEIYTVRWAVCPILSVCSHPPTKEAAETETETEWNWARNSRSKYRYRPPRQCMVSITQFKIVSKWEIHGDNLK